MTKSIKFFLIAFILSFPFWWGVNAFQENLEKFFYAQTYQPFEEIPIVELPQRPQKTQLELEARAAISVKIKNTGQKFVLFEKNSKEPLPIASLTKLMTALIVLEDKNYDLKNTWVTISEEAANQANVPNYGNLKRGEKFNVEQLLELMLIYSSNDAAFALSEVIETENFIEKMNQKTIELNLKNTNFVNPTGLDPENLYYHLPNQNYFNYSTAKDLVKLSQYIFKEHPIILEISLRKGAFPTANGISEISLPEGTILLGGKTGYTTEAGGCILLVLKNENNDFFINVILGTPSVEARIEEMEKLINQPR